MITLTISFLVILFSTLISLQAVHAVSTLSTGPNKSSLYLVGLDGKVWTNFFPAADGSAKWNGWLPVGDNTFPIVTVPVPPSPPLHIKSFRANPTQVQPNQQTTLSWNVENCDVNCSVHITKRVPGIGDNLPVKNNLQPAGSVSVNVDPPIGAFYKLWASNPTTSTSSAEVGVGIIGGGGTVGYSKIVMNNAHVDHRSVNIWTNDNGQWRDEGTLDYGSSKTLSLTTGHVYTVVAVDQGAIGCNGNNPLTVSCQRFTTPRIQGNADGGNISFTVS